MNRLLTFDEPSTLDETQTLRHSATQDLAAQHLANVAADDATGSTL